MCQKRGVKSPRLEKQISVVGSKECDPNEGGIRHTEIDTPLQVNIVPVLVVDPVCKSSVSNSKLTFGHASAMCHSQVLIHTR